MDLGYFAAAFGYPSQTVIGQNCPVGPGPNSANPTGPAESGYCGNWECWCDCMWDPLVNPVANSRCKSKPGFAVGVPPWIAGGAQQRGIPILDTTMLGEGGTILTDIAQGVGSVFHMPATIVGPATPSPSVAPVTLDELNAMRAGATVGLPVGISRKAKYIAGGIAILLAALALRRHPPPSPAPPPAVAGYRRRKRR